MNSSPQNEPFIRSKSLLHSKKQHIFANVFIKQPLEKRSLTLSKYNKKEIEAAMDEALNYNFTKVNVD